MMAKQKVEPVPVDQALWALGATPLFEVFDVVTEAAASGSQAVTTNGRNQGPIESQILKAAFSGRKDGESAADLVRAWLDQGPDHPKWDHLMTHVASFQPVWIQACLRMMVAEYDRQDNDPLFGYDPNHPDDLVTEPGAGAGETVTINNGVVTDETPAGTCSVTMNDGVVTKAAGQVEDSVTIIMMGKLTTILVNYDKAIATLAEMKQEQARLEGLGLCSGVPWYRQLAGGQALYANHGVGASCPLHGEPESGGRLRKYIGQNGQARLVLEAMERYAHWEALATDLRDCERRIREIERLVDKALRVSEG